MNKQKILFLETKLDPKPSSNRNSIDFMKSFFKTQDDIDFESETIHSKVDLLKFLVDAKKYKNLIATHISAHGKGSKNICSLIFTKNEEIDLTKSENQKIFQDLNSRILFFSCCQIGRNADVMNKILKLSKAEAIFSYSDDVNDDQTFLIESIFYHLFIGYNGYNYNQLPIHIIYEKLKNALDFLLIDSRRDKKDILLNPLLVFYSVKS
jgi:hypothetical protein